MSAGAGRRNIRAYNKMTYRLRQVGRVAPRAVAGYETNGARGATRPTTRGILLDALSLIAGKSWFRPRKCL